MQWLSPTLLAIQVITSLGIIVLVLLQQGKGADMGSSFGGGSAGSLFGATGAANFLSRTTKWVAIIFFASTGGLAYIAHHPGSSILDVGGIMQGYQDTAPAPAPAGSAVPAVPGRAPASVAPDGGSAAPASKAVPDTSAVPSVPPVGSSAGATSEPAVSNAVPSVPSVAPSGSGQSAQPAATSDTTQPAASQSAAPGANTSTGSKAK